MTSLAASPLLPLGTAALAGALIVGTMFGGNSETVDEEPAATTTTTAAAAPVEPVTAPVEPVAEAPAAAAVKLGGTCAAGPSCVATFPLAGGTATILGIPVTIGPSTAKAVAVTAPAKGTVAAGKVVKVGTLKFKIQAAGAKNVRMLITK